jgi:hypothetical protein
MSGQCVMRALALGLLLALPSLSFAAAEPNTQVPAGSRHYAATTVPDRIVASPAADPSHGSPWPGAPMAACRRRCWRSPWPQIRRPSRASARCVRRPARCRPRTVCRTTIAPTSRPAAGYPVRLPRAGQWQLERLEPAAHAGRADQPLTLLYFGDTQNKNVSHVSRVVRAAQKAAPQARMSLFAGDLVSGGDNMDDSEWGEWFAATGWLAQETLVAPAIGNHEYFEEFEDTPQERRVLGRHWPVTFALPGNGAAAAQQTSYWFDAQGVRVAVVDGTSALDLGTAKAQAQWLDKVLTGNPQPWTIVLLHQPFYSPREGRENAALRDVLLPVVRRHNVDLVLQGHDHTYGRRGEGQAATPQYVVTVAGTEAVPPFRRSTQDDGSGGRGHPAVPGAEHRPAAPAL